MRCLCSGELCVAEGDAVLYFAGPDGFVVGCALGGAFGVCAALGLRAETVEVRLRSVLSLGAPVGFFPRSWKLAGARRGRTCWDVCALAVGSRDVFRFDCGPCA